MHDTAGNSTFTTIIIIYAPNLNPRQSLDIRREDFLRNRIVICNECEYCSP